MTVSGLLSQSLEIVTIALAPPLVGWVNQWCAWPQTNPRPASGSHIARCKLFNKESVG